MKKEIENRVKDEANFIVKNEGTVRSISKYFFVSKSTIHFDLTVRLKDIDYKTFLIVKGILKRNFLQKNIRGGEATKKKYNLLKNSQNT